METNTNSQHRQQAQPQETYTWRKILNLLIRYSEPLCDVEEATGHKHDPREWAD